MKNKALILLLLGILFCLFLNACRNNIEEKLQYNIEAEGKKTKYNVLHHFTDFEYKILKTDDINLIKKLVLSDYYYNSVFKKHCNIWEAKFSYLATKRHFLLKLAKINKPSYNKLLLKFYYPNGAKKIVLDKQFYFKIIDKIEEPWSSVEKKVTTSILDIKKTKDKIVIDSDSEGGSSKTVLVLRTIDNQNVWIPVEHFSTGEY